METVLAYVLWYVVSVVIGAALLVASMFLASAVYGGIEFGTPGRAIIRALLAVTIVYLLDIPLSYVPFGWALGFLLWLGVFMKLFDLDLWEAATLTLVNWAINLLLTYYLLGWMLTRAIS
jgi:hypothetical protein